nr:hypothetical protein [Tanacetum cinerariifolium]
MLDRTDFASWQQRIRLYCRGKDNGVNILKSIDEGPYKMGTYRETLVESTEGTPQFGPERPRIYSDLNSEEKDRFAKLINDMRNIKMTMSKLQLNSKFVNNMLPEWGRYVTAVKLNRGLRDSNYDQLYAYLKQHETHAKENKMMLERLSQPTSQPTADPLALLSNVSNTHHGSPSLSTSSFTQLPPARANSSSPADDLIENLTSTLALLTQLYRTFLPQTNNQLRTSSNARNQATVQDGRVMVQNAQENGVALDAEQLLFLAGGPDNAFNDDVDEQPVQDLALNVDNVFQDEDCDAFDSDVQDHDQYLNDTCTYQEEHVMHDSYVKDNEVPVVHSNASSVQNDTFMMIYNDMCEPSALSVSNSSRNAVVKNSLTAELATYREQVELYGQRAKFELTE